MPDAHIAQLTAVETLAHVDDLAAVYRAVFTLPPHNETADDLARFTGGMLPRHAVRRDFRCCVAHATRDDGPLDGFVYGYTGEPGQYWRDLVAGALDPATTAAWLPDAFEVVTLAVVPTQRGRGLGAALLAAILHGLPNPTALLSTKRLETPALNLYRTRGWVTLGEPLLFPGSPAEYLVMGKRL